MKKAFFVPAAAISILLACKSQNQQAPITAPTPAPPVAPAKKMTERPAGAVTKDMANVKFASKNDPVCGMPLRIGIEDTMHYKGKIYGFCASGCKEEFVKDPKSYLEQQ